MTCQLNSYVTSYDHYDFPLSIHHPSIADTFFYLIRYFHHLILHFLILSTFRANDSLIRCLRPPYNVQQKEV